MPAIGIEPIREYKSRRILSPVRLPVPPRRQRKKPVVPVTSYTWYYSSEWAEVDSNHRSNLQQIYSLSPLATRESTHSSRITAPDNIVLYTILFQKSRGFWLNFDLFAEQTHPKRADTLYLWLYRCGLNVRVNALTSNLCSEATNIESRFSSGVLFFDKTNK